MIVTVASNIVTGKGKGILYASQGGVGRVCLEGTRRLPVSSLSLPN